MAGLKSLTELQQIQSDLIDEAEATNDVAVEEKRDLTKDENIYYDEKVAAAEAMKPDIVRAEKRLERKNARSTARGSNAVDVQDEGTQQTRISPIALRFPVKNFKGTSLDGKRPEERAFRFGSYMLAKAASDMPSRCNFPEATEFCKNNIVNVASTGSQSNAAVFIPEEFGQDLILLREEFGVARRLAKVVPMQSDTRTDPRWVSGLTATFTAENATATESDTAWDNVQLVAKTLTAITRMSNEFNQDSVINFGDTLIREITYAFVNVEDRVVFTGDGTSTDGGISGVQTQLDTLTASLTVGGLVLAGDNNYSLLVMGDFEQVVARLPVYADTPNAAWVCHKTFWSTTMFRLELAAGGTIPNDIRQGERSRPKFLGYPVEFSQLMPSVEANNQIPVFLGDLSLSVTFGDRMQETISFSEHATIGGEGLWERNQIGIRGTQRFDAICHSFGTDTTPGPVVGLQMGAS